MDRISKVAILGSTGSIGRATLDVLSRLRHRFEITLISCHRQLDLFSQQIHAFAPKHAVVTGPIDRNVDRYLAVRDQTTRGVGMESVSTLVQSPDVDIVVGAIVGVAGLESSLAAVMAGKRLALANKEALVVSGSLMKQAVETHGAELIPIDSEHSAIFQCLRCGKPETEVARLILTASGGPLRDWPIEDLASATIEDALSHPTWQMGRKITVDSATMMNKALEVIEACWLFDLEPDQITVMVHPQSMIHSMVEFVDGSVMAQLSPPDMRLPIQYALTYPDRIESPATKVDWTVPMGLTWTPADMDRYPALLLGFEVARNRGTCGAVLNAANEAAVELFLAGKIRLTDIPSVCRSVLDSHPYSPSPSLKELLQLDVWGRNEVYKWTQCQC